MNKKSSGTNKKIVWIFLAMLVLLGQEYIFGALFVVSYMFWHIPINDNATPMVAHQPHVGGDLGVAQLHVKNLDSRLRVNDSYQPSKEFIEQKQAAAELPKVESPILKPSSSSFSLQVASVANHDAAIKFAEKLKAKGYETLVVAGEVNGKKVYRVRLQGFASYKEAETARNKFEQEEGARGLIIAQQS